MNTEIKISTIFWNIVILAVQIWLGYYFDWWLLLTIQILQFIVIIANEGNYISEYIWLSNIIIYIFLICWVIIDKILTPPFSWIYNIIRKSIISLNQFLDEKLPEIFNNQSESEHK